MAKLREHVESLKKENFELMGDLEAQRVQVRYYTLSKLWNVLVLGTHYFNYYTPRCNLKDPRNII